MQMHHDYQHLFQGGLRHFGERERLAVTVSVQQVSHSEGQLELSIFCCPGAIPCLRPYSLASGRADPQFSAQNRESLTFIEHG